MIHMPQRSVTRFFVPMIDVLLLLFCIFLLMPIANQEELDASRTNSDNLQERTEILDRELQRRTKELREYESLKPKLDEVKRLVNEIKQLREAGTQPLHQRYFFQIIDIDPKTGDLYYIDPFLPGAKNRFKIDSQQKVNDLIARHKKLSDGRELYYYFLYPRPMETVPSVDQERRYYQWFANGDVHTSLEVAVKQ